MKKYFLFFSFNWIIISCTQQKNESVQIANAPQIWKSKGHTIQIDKSKSKVACDSIRLKIICLNKPNIVNLKTNKPSSVKPDSVEIKPGTLQVDTLIQDDSKRVLAVDSLILSGMPRIELAGDAYIKEHNTANFSSFGKLQGLKQGTVKCILEDTKGNIWFGTNGGGLSKYDGKNFTHITENEGLSNNNVKAILEDKRGNFWFGTYKGGVTKYDGKYFTHYKQDALKSNDVNSIIQDHDGNIWFGTNDGGVTKYDGKYFTHFNDENGLCYNVVLSILEDKSKNIWFGTKKGISKYDYKGKYFTKFTMKNGLCDSIVLSMIEDRNKNIWIGTENGVSKYTGSYFVNYKKNNGLGIKNVTSILEDKNGVLWFGSADGVLKYDGKEFRHYTEEDGLSNNNITSIHEDRSGNIWFGTLGGGVTRYGGNSFTYFTKKSGLRDSDVNAIVEDSNKNLLFGTVNGGLAIYDGLSFTNITDSCGLPKNYIRSILKDKYGNLWLGTKGGGVCKYDGEYLLHFTDLSGMFNKCNIMSMLEDRNGNLWFGTSNGLYKYDTYSLTNFTISKNESYNGVLSMLEDKDGNLWLGTEGEGVFKYDQVKQTFISYTVNDGLPDNSVWSMIKDNRGDLWFGTYGGGVSKYDYEGKYFINFTDKQGLSNNVVFSILQDRKKNIWFGTRFGLSELSESKLTIINDTVELKKQSTLFNKYTYEDGFFGIGCNENAICEDSNGTIWIGANERLTAFKPDMEKADSIKPDIEINRIELFNENIAWASLLNKKGSILTLGNGVKVQGFEFDSIRKWYNLPEHLSLNYDNNYITFNFIGIKQKHNKQIEYQYFLVEKNYYTPWNCDTIWNSKTNRTYATYGNLAPGEYTFIVNAISGEGIKSKSIPYTFTICPPWWKMKIAYVFYFLICCCMVNVIIDFKSKEEVLYKTLPRQVAKEIIKFHKFKTRKHDKVTVMFTDFKGYTKISEKYPPAKLVQDLDFYFKKFDEIILKHKIEKIKTMGDGYMCAGGVPDENNTNATDVVNAALEILKFMNDDSLIKTKEGIDKYEIRIGVHTGPLVAGVLGNDKYVYDIFGDTVNMASRMESSGAPGKINISESTYELVKDKFNCIPRGKIDAKNKGEMNMYFVEAIES